MPWILVDDKMRNHPKVLEAGPLAAWQFVAGLGYASEYLTDGFIPTAALAALVPNQSSKVTRQLTETLVRVGMWEERDGGYQIHDYHDYQPTAAEVQQKRAAAAARKAAWLERERERKRNADGTRSPRIPGASSGTRAERACDAPLLPSYSPTHKDLTAFHKARGVEPEPEAPPGEADEAAGELLTPGQALAKVSDLVAKATRAAPGAPVRNREITLSEARERGRRMAAANGGGEA